MYICQKQVRSLTLDVEVWEPSIIALFRALGNAFPNSACEELLQASKNIRADEMPKRFALRIRAWPKHFHLI
ncbi:unnamed protein product [Cuscuta campestris]|uniref:Uncharacterized protein n=1 Tax=Cuscuta campestris TaxID=132261 RepID=A0A484MWD0_9ASTE|nr:unnamed protein product [Cuscuta campestris]